jgi:hypothetical protein
MNATQADAGVGGVYRAPQAPHTRSSAKATSRSGFIRRKADAPHFGQLLVERRFDTA